MFCKCKSRISWDDFSKKSFLDLDQGPPTWMDFDIYMRKARPFVISQGTMIWYQSLTYLTRFRAVSVFTHPPRISRFILFHRISGRDTNYMWHHIVKTLSRTAARKEAWTGGRRTWKEAPGCHSESIVIFFSRPNKPYCREKSTVPSCVSGNEGVQPS